MLRTSPICSTRPVNMRINLVRPDGASARDRLVHASGRGWRAPPAYGAEHQVTSYEKQGIAPKNGYQSHVLQPQFLEQEYEEDDQDHPHDGAEVPPPA